MKTDQQKKDELIKFFVDVAFEKIVGTDKLVVDREIRKESGRKSSRSVKRKSS